MSERPSRPLILGEVLFDCFPDTQTLGGAPFNVAWHLQGFGLQPYLISAVGTDALGAEILQQMQAWGLDRSGIQQDPLHPTGRVQISFCDHQHRFEILPEQAYDYIQPPLLETGAFSLLYHGSLACRGPVTAATVAGLRRSGLPVFVDINLRDPWWTLAEIESSFQQARWLKINEEELTRLADALAISGDFRGQLALALQARYGLTALIVTCGAEGAFMLDQAGQVYSVTPEPGTAVVDTVGAGDAFSAVAIWGLLAGWPSQLLLARAQAFAQAICGIRGAVSADRALYAQHLAAWQTTGG